MDPKDLQILAKYQSTLCVHEEDHPDHHAYIRACERYALWVLGDRTYDDIETELKAKQNVQRIQYQELYRLESLANPTTIIKRIQETRDKISGAKENKKNYPYLWLTVNPGPDMKFIEFQKIVYKAFQKKWLDSYVYVYEQRGICREELGKGFHLHCIIQIPIDKKSSVCIKELANTFKKCCDTSNYHFFQTKLIDEEEYHRKLKYILAEKDSTSQNMKAEKQAMDVIWRDMSHIDKYYFLNINLGRYG